MPPSASWAITLPVSRPIMTSVVLRALVIQRWMVHRFLGSLT